jgi:putative drug exporter of the RND superfamily
VTAGIAASVGVVTSAAIIIVAVFSIFATISFVDVKTLGVGLPRAGRRDVVRGILVPAAMTHLGERTADSTHSGSRPTNCSPASRARAGPTA